MSGSARKTWEELYRRFDPESPPERRDWIADRPGSPIESMGAEVGRPFGVPHFLLAATPGTGTTTELMRLHARLGQGHRVVFLDLVRHFSERVRDLPALQAITPQEVLFLVGLHVVRFGEETLGLVWPAHIVSRLERAWEDILADGQKSGTSPSVSVPALVAGLGKAAATALNPAAGLAASAVSAVVGALDWKLPLGGSHHPLEDQDQASRALLEAVNDLIGHFQLTYLDRLVVIVDGLDRIDESTGLERLFLRSQLLASLHCATVFAAPFLLRHGLENAGVRGVEFRVLGNARVFSDKDPALAGPEVDFFLNLFRLRAADLGPKGSPGVSDALVGRLAQYSGGRVRDFVRMVRNLAGLAWDADAGEATGALVDRVIDDARRQIEHGLNRHHVDLLASVLADPAHRLPEDPAAWELLRFFRLLPYANGFEWYHPHPLLTLRLLSKPSP